MDKQSFSRYGGIVIVVIILSMMIAFATPFGSFVVNGVKDVLGNFNSTGGNAMDNDYGDIVDFPYPGTGSGGNNGGSGGSGGSGSGSEEQTIAAGLYETGSNYTVLLASWEDLLADGTVHVENGVVYTNFDTDAWETASADALAGDLMLPNDGSITALGNLAWDDTIYNEEWDEYGAYTGNAAFTYCYNLTGIVIPDSVVTISASAFECCESLHSINIPAGITTIGYYAFSLCGITSIEIPDSVITMDSAAFDSCTSLESITFGENSQLTSIGDYVFTNCEALTSIEIPDGVTSIGDYAFADCTALTSITIPDSVTTIGYYVFGSCTSLESITFGENSQLTSIGEQAFVGCRKLTHIEIPASVTTIGSCAFKDSPVLATVTFRENSQLTTIDGWAFDHCEALTNITIPESVTSIGDGAFIGCTSLTSIIFEGTVAQWNAISKGDYWHPHYTTTVTCSDGTVTLN